MQNINVNLKQNRFESKVSKDSIFEFDKSVFDYVVINGRKFKNLYVSLFKENSICEVIVEDDNYMMLQVYRSDVKENEPDPLMIKPDVDEYIVKSWNYIKKGDNMQRFDFNKKNNIKLFSDKNEEIESFVKEKKLSWKKVEDFKQMYLKWKTL